MTDIDSKVAFLAYYVEWICRIAKAIPDDYLSRVYGRGLFLGVDSFLKLAPRLKNTLRTEGRLNQQASTKITTKINKLRNDYEDFYATVRDKFSAHQQEVDLSPLLATWNEIDESTLVILTDDVYEIWNNLKSNGARSRFVRPPELDDELVLANFSTLRNPSGVHIGVDRFAFTRSNTVAQIPFKSPFQEKAIRVLTAFEGYQTLIKTGLEYTTSQLELPKKATIDLFVVDACSVIDNLFQDRAENPYVPAEESLVEIWRENDVCGIELLEQFQRDNNLEEKLRELRNKFSAHIDPDLRLVDLQGLFSDFPIQALHAYLQNIWIAFEAVCKRDHRTRMFTIHDQELDGVISVEHTNAVKPFWQN